MTKVVCRTSYKLALNNPDRNKIYNNKDIKYINGIIDYYADDKKRVLNMIDYFTGKINNHDDSNLVLENGKYASKEKLDKRKKKISKQFNNSNVWQIVLSFDKHYIDQNITYKELEQDLAKRILPRLFKMMGFKEIKNMTYQFSLHMNTDNPHFHISFLENKPNYINSKGDLVYKKVGKIDNETIKWLKKEVTLDIERKKYFTPKSTNINQDIEEIKKYFNPGTKDYILYDKENILLEKKILTLGKLINDNIKSTNSRIKYNSIDNEDIIKLTKDIKEDLFKNNKLDVSKKEFNNSIKNMNDYLKKIIKDNGLKKEDIDLSYTEHKEEYLNNYVLNAIVNHARFEYKNIINPDDILSSIAYQRYLRNEELDKKQIVINSFNNNYVLQNEVESAIRNMNKEMEEAAELFYNMSKKKKKKFLK